MWEAKVAGALDKVLLKLHAVESGSQVLECKAPPEQLPEDSNWHQMSQSWMAINKSVAEALARRRLEREL